ncbi:MAG: nicotinate-nucleotide adenylyltransferase [Caldilineaceae bacterium]
MEQRIGIYGGTFDPIHIGHLILAEEARFQLQLDRVYLAPAGDPPHKQSQPITPVRYRVQMAELATAELEHIWVSRVDADRPGPHYTTDMVRLMREQVGPTAELYFLMGMDSLRDLPTWQHPQWLIEQCKVVALTRHDVTIDWTVLEAALPGIRERVILLDMPELEIASHTLRERIRKGWPICYQMPPAVAAYIRKHQLYIA